MFRHGSRMQAWMATVAMLVYLLISLTPAEGLVLCIGEDGHIAIEVASLEDDCADCIPSGALAQKCCAPQQDVQEPASCSCSDIPLLTKQIERGSTAPQRGVPTVPPACILAGASVDPVPQLTARLGHQSAAQAPPCPRVPTQLTLRI